MGGDVAQSGRIERIVASLVGAVGLQRAFGAIWVVVVLVGKAVVDEEEEATIEEPREVLEKGVAPAKLGLVAVGKIVSQEGESVGIVLDEIAPSEGAILVQVDPTLVPAATGESQEFHGQGIEDFVGEHDSELSPVLPGSVGRLQVGFLTLGEACGENGSLARGVFAGSVAERGAEIRRELMRPFENVESKGAVFRPSSKM